jgi:hypothetical protein
MKICDSRVSAMVGVADLVFPCAGMSRTKKTLQFVYGLLE